jgi:hypothetical protein
MVSSVQACTVWSCILFSMPFVGWTHMAVCCWVALGATERSLITAYCRKGICIVSCFPMCSLVPECPALWGISLGVTCPVLVKVKP